MKEQRPECSCRQEEEPQNGGSLLTEEQTPCGKGILPNGIQDLDIVIYDLLKDLELQLLGSEPEIHGITPKQTILLRKVRQVSRATASQIGEMMGITSGPVTTLTHGLVEKQLLERTVDVDDRRVVWFALTERGEALIREVIAHRQANVQAFLGALPTHSRDDFYRLYGDVRNALKALR